MVLTFTSSPDCCCSLAARALAVLHAFLCVASKPAALLLWTSPEVCLTWTDQQLCRVGCNSYSIS